MGKPRVKVSAPATVDINTQIMSAILTTRKTCKTASEHSKQASTARENLRKLYNDFTTEFVAVLATITDTKLKVWATSVATWKPKAKPVTTATTTVAIPDAKTAIDFLIAKGWTILKNGNLHPPVITA